MTHARTLDAFSFSGVSWYSYVMPLVYGVARPYVAMLRDTADTLALAEQSGDDLGLDLARSARGIALIHSGGRDRGQGLDLLLTTWERQGPLAAAVFQRVIDRRGVHRARAGPARRHRQCCQVGPACGRAPHRRGSIMWNIPATAALVEVLLTRRLDRDLAEADAVIQKWTTMTCELGVTLHEVWSLRMRAQLARARNEESSYQELRQRYRRKADQLGFEGHMERPLRCRARVTKNARHKSRSHQTRPTLVGYTKLTGVCLWVGFIGMPKGEVTGLPSSRRPSA